ncbi:HD domain-containing protein, partial [Enterococcus faecium]|uniref:HD domain-containing protein n=1 Tax=Enterococcus faecium TaxID=1352 RepID=UPI0027107864|nr:HD domain-containing protein [Enterococcus faecium]
MTRQYTSHASQIAEPPRALLLSIAQDVRVILYQFADRRHRVRTLEHMRATQQHRIAQYTRYLS